MHVSTLLDLARIKISILQENIEETMADSVEFFDDSLMPEIIPASVSKYSRTRERNQASTEISSQSPSSQCSRATVSSYGDPDHLLNEELRDALIQFQDLIDYNLVTCAKYYEDRKEINLR